MTVPLGKLVGKLLHADLELGEGAPLLSVCQRHLSVESVFEQLLEAHQDRPGLGFGSVGIATLPGLELVLFRRAAWADSILRIARSHFWNGASIVGTRLRTLCHGCLLT